MTPFSDDAWAAWKPNALMGRMKGCRAHWYIVGGWALDLWHQAQTRPHDDLEFATLTEGLDLCRNQLRDLAFFAAHNGTLTHVSHDHPLPKGIWQFWGADQNAQRWRVDMMVERGDPQTWVYKRNPAIQLPRQKAIRHDPTGIPYLAPHLVLLFKGKYQRAKDEADFQRALPHLTGDERSDLRGWLNQLHQGHDWAARLNTQPTVHFRLALGRNLRSLRQPTTGAPLCPLTTPPTAGTRTVSNGTACKSCSASAPMMGCLCGSQIWNFRRRTL